MNAKRKALLFSCAVLLITMSECGASAAPPEAASSQQASETFAPRQAKLPVPPPADAIILFNGELSRQFVSMAGESLDWPVHDSNLVSQANGRRSNHAISRLHFRDADVHVEFKLPMGTDSNSGVYFQGLYEIQILNSWDKAKLGDGEMGAIYGLKAPLANAARPPGQWQVLDVRFRTPRRNGDGAIIATGSISAWLNGKLIHDRVSLEEPNSKYNPYQYDTTPYLQAIWKEYRRSTLGPLVLQDHDSPVCYRNVWVKPLDDRAVECVAHE